MSLKLSDEAVDAAAEGLAESFGFDNPRYMHPDKGWPKHARAALTAALPHMLPSEEEIARALAAHSTGGVCAPSDPSLAWEAWLSEADAVLALLNGGTDV